MPLLSALSGNFFAASPDNGMRSVVLNNMLSAAPVLSYARWFSHAGNAHQMTKATPNNVTTWRVRDIGTELSPVVPPPPDYVTANLRIFGDKVQTDIAYEFQNPADLLSYHQRNLEKFAQAMGRDFTNRFINDDPTSDARLWLGLKGKTALTTPLGMGLLGGTTRSTEFGTGNGDFLSSDDTPAAKKAARRFVELLNKVDKETVTQGGGTKAILMPSEVVYRMAALGLPYLQLSSTTDLLSQPVDVASWKGIPIIQIGKAADLATDIIAYDETVGTSSDCTSVYFCVFNEEADLTFNSNVGVAVEGLIRTNNFIQNRVELQAGLTLVNPQSISRIEGIRLD